MTNVAWKDVDRGWAWCVLAASYFNLLMCSGLSFTVGLIQISLLEHFQGSVALTSWITALFSSAMQLGGPLSSWVANRYSCRTSVMLGGVFMSVGFVASGLVNSLTLLFVFLGIIAGIGNGLVYTPSVVIVNYFFDKRRVFANSLILSASGLGVFAMPHIANFLLVNFSWKEAFLVMGGVSAHICIAGAVMFSCHEQNNERKSHLLYKAIWRSLCSKRPRNDQSKIKNNIENESHQSFIDEKVVSAQCYPSESLFSKSQYLSNKIKNENPSETTFGKLSFSHCQVDRTCNEDDDKKKNIVLKKFSTSLQELPRNFHHCDNNCLHVNKEAETSGAVLETTNGAEYLYSRLPQNRDKMSIIATCSNPSLITGVSPTQHLNFIVPECQDDCESVKMGIRKNFIEQSIEIKTDISDLQKATENNSYIVSSPSRYPPLFKNRLFWMLCTNLFMANAGCGLFNIHVPGFYQSRGMSEQEITNCLSSHGLTLLFARLLVGALATSVNDGLVLYISLTVLGGIFTLMIPPLGSTNEANILLMIGMTLYGQSSYALLPTLTIQYVGLQHLATAFGVEMVFAGLGYLVAPPLAGHIVDLTHSYDYSIYLSGVLYVLAGVMLLAVPCMEKARGKEKTIMERSSDPETNRHRVNDDNVNNSGDNDIVIIQLTKDDKDP